MKKKYFSLKNYEYSFFYLFVFIGMAMHFMYKDGASGLLVSSMEQYIVFALGIFCVYGYFAIQSKKVRQTFILNYRTDIYSKKAGASIAIFIHKYTPFIFMSIIGMLEINILKVSYYSHFYLLLIFATMILLVDYYLGNKMKQWKE